MQPCCSVEKIHFIVCSFLPSHVTQLYFWRYLNQRYLRKTLGHLSTKLLNTGVLLQINGRFSSLQQLVVSIINLARSLHCQFSVHSQILSILQSCKSPAVVLNLLRVSKLGFLASKKIEKFTPAKAQMPKYEPPNVLGNPCPSTRKAGMAPSLYTVMASAPLIW